VSANGILHVALSEYRVTPQQVNSAAGTLTIFVHNHGRLNHSLAISLNGVSAASTQPIRPGQSAVLIATLAPGRYLMASTVLSDQALGAYGSLTVGR